jgi:nitrate reductase NapE
MCGHNGSPATDRPGTTARDAPPHNTRRAEILAFIVLAVLIWPVLAVGVVGGYGFVVWLSQIILGPPGPPH